MMCLSRVHSLDNHLGKVLITPLRMVKYIRRVRIVCRRLGITDCENHMDSSKLSMSESIRRTKRINSLHVGLPAGSEKRKQTGQTLEVWPSIAGGGRSTVFHSVVVVPYHRLSLVAIFWPSNG